MHLSDAGVRSLTANPGQFYQVPLGNNKVAYTYLIYDSDAWYPTPLQADFENKYGSWPPNRDDHREAYADQKDGWLALVRQVQVGVNDYQFVVIPYAKFTAVAYLVDRPSLVHVSATEFRMDNVEVVQTSSGCVIRFKRSEFYSLRFLSIGSPVILDGADPTDSPYIGKFPTIVGIYQDPVEPEYTVARLSGDLFPDEMETVREDRGIWLVRGDSLGAPSPAIGCSVFRTKLQP